MKCADSLFHHSQVFQVIIKQTAFPSFYFIVSKMGMLNINTFRLYKYTFLKNDLHILNHMKKWYIKFLEVFFNFLVLFLCEVCLYDYNICKKSSFFLNIWFLKVNHIFRILNNSHFSARRPKERRIISLKRKVLRMLMSEKKRQMNGQQTNYKMFKKQALGFQE